MTKQESEDTKTALIAKDISYIQKDIADIKMSVKDLAGVYITKQEFEEFKKLMLETVSEIKSSSNFWKWFSPTFTAVLTAVITFLIIQYLTHFK